MCTTGMKGPPFHVTFSAHQWRTEGGGLGVETPPKIPKVLQNHVKLKPIVKTVKNC